MIAHITADLGGNRIRRIGSATPSTSTWPTPGQEARDQITGCAAVPGSRSKDHVSPSLGDGSTQYALSGWSGSLGVQTARGEEYRMVSQEVLPFPRTRSASTAGRTMQESVYERRVEPRRLPDDAPNILIVLIDDVGPALPTTFGGEIRTDMLTRIYQEGIGYNRFHTTAMCSPTRASLLTGP